MLKGTTDIDGVFNAIPSIPKQRQQLLKFNGWGYSDAGFSVTSEGNIFFAGSNYDILNNSVLPNFRDWMKRTCDIDINNRMDLPSVIHFDESLIRNEVRADSLVEEMRRQKLDVSTDAGDRIFRAHGHTMSEIYTLRKGHFPRVPDIVVWPRCHDEVVAIVGLAGTYNAAVIPFGGGTSVTGALLCSADEKRPIISVDMSQMNKILWVDEANMTVRMEAGIIGQEMEQRLAKIGYCVGHEPDSIEFSSLGGWVATRASGMKKNVYGNIEDLLVHVSMVTPQGVIQKAYQVPRVSNGPDVHHFIMGSEGRLGIITEVTLKLRKLPKFKKYASVIFPDFETGFNYLREIARQKQFPASIRLMDNEQFHFGLALKSQKVSMFSRFADGLKKLYLLKYKSFDPYKLCVATIVMEGSSKHEIVQQEKNLLTIAKEFQGISGGEENGKRGYMLTFVIAYIRDLALDHCVLAESFETSVSWDRALDLCSAVKRRVVQEAKNLGVVKPVFVTCRITQIYDAGVCVYFYLALNYTDFVDSIGNVDPIHIYETVESAARDEILTNGGSLSHHHGIGKIRKHWMEQVISPTGMLALKAIKKSLDPDNLFANGSLFDDSKLNAKM